MTPELPDWTRDQWLRHFMDEAGYDETTARMLVSIEFGDTPGDLVDLDEWSDLDTESE